MKSRDDAWHQVWNDRPPEKADWNGYESTFSDQVAYEDWVNEVAALICRSLDLTPTDEVIDLGCGSGRFAQLIAPKVQSLLAYDYSQPALDLAIRYRSAHNLAYQQVDLNDPPADLFKPGIKMYAVGSMFYLKAVDHVLELVAGCVNQGGTALLLDLPDKNIRDDRDRGYDRGQYSHLAFTETDFDTSFKGCRFIRGQFPNYVNDAVRFSVLVPPQGSPAIATASR